MIDYVPLINGATLQHLLKKRIILQHEFGAMVWLLFYNLHSKRQVIFWTHCHCERRRRHLPFIRQLKAQPRYQSARTPLVKRTRSNGAALTQSLLSSP